MAAAGWDATGCAAQLAGHVAELRSRSAEERFSGARGIRDLVLREATDLPTDAFARVVGALNRLVTALVHSSDATDRESGVLLLKALIDITSDEGAAKHTRDAEIVAHLLSSAKEQPTLMFTASALGQLARVGGAVVADFVEAQVKLAIEWLAAPLAADVGGAGARRLCAALVCTQVATQAPVMFSPHVENCLTAVWTGVHHGRQTIREASVATVGACLDLLPSAVDATQQDRMHSLVVDAVHGGLATSGKASVPLDAVQGSLLVLGELARHPVRRLQSPAAYEATIRAALAVASQRSKPGKVALLHVLPRLAAFSPELFLAHGLDGTMAVVLQVLRSGPGDTRGAAFAAVGGIARTLGRDSALAIARALLPFCEDALPRRPASKRPVLAEAVRCVGHLAATCGPRQIFEGPQAFALFDSLVRGGLTPQFVAAARDVVEHGSASDLARRARAAVFQLVMLSLANASVAECIPGDAEAMAVFMVHPADEAAAVASAPPSPVPADAPALVLRAAMNWPSLHEGGAGDATLEEEDDLAEEGAEAHGRDGWRGPGEGSADDCPWNVPEVDWPGAGPGPGFVEAVPPTDAGSQQKLLALHTLAAFPWEASPAALRWLARARRGRPLTCATTASASGRRPWWRARPTWRACAGGPGSAPAPRRPRSTAFCRR